MDSFGILDFALPLGAVALVLLGWAAVSRLRGRKAQAREAADRRRAERAGGAS